MNRYRVLVCVLLLAVIGIITACNTEVEEVTFDQLFTAPNQYHGKNIIVEGFYFHGFEVIVLSERLEYSGYAPGHLVPKGRMVWVDGSIPEEVYDQMYQQQMMGPTERYGKVRVTGKVEYGGSYGHLGAYDTQITPVVVEILPWSPPAVPAAIANATCS